MAPYTISANFDEDEKLWIAEVAEVPGVRGYGKSKAEAERDAAAAADARGGDKPPEGTKK